VPPTLTFLSPPSPCEYLPDRESQLRYEFTPEIARDEYMDRLRGGWRRFGPIIFRPECPSCRMCRSLRVPVDSFRASHSQRRAWKRNTNDVTIRIGQPSVSAEKLTLYARFHRHGHEVKGWPPNVEQRLDMFVRNPFETEEWTYYAGDRLIGVGYVDVLREGLSAIYFYWDPAEQQRSLGTFNILALIAAARDRGLPHVYLGYYVEGCRSLEYKARFAPNEVLGPEGAWEPFVM
jgi:arginine-tRNA-protein transferase